LGVAKAVGLPVDELHLTLRTTSQDAHMAGTTAPLSRSLHPDILVVAE